MIAPLWIGLVFGWLLERAGLTRYDRIVGVYRLSDLAVLEFLGSALAMGSVALQVALWLGLASSAPVPATIAVAQVTGGALFGVGMAIGGFCPGTIVAGAATGQLDYLVPGVLGLLAGAWLGPHVAALVPGASQGAVTLPGLLSVLLLEVAVFGFYALERGVRRQLFSARKAA